MQKSTWFIYINRGKILGKIFGGGRTIYNRRRFMVKITKKQLKQIIKEEASYVLSENSERIKALYKHWEEYEMAPLLTKLDTRKSVIAAEIKDTAYNVFQKLIDAVARADIDIQPLLDYRNAADNAADLKDQGKDIGSEFAVGPMANIRNALGI